MTPLIRLYIKLLPRFAVLPALALTYALLIYLTVVFGNYEGGDFIYIDFDTR